jgi:hypothetical protein
MSKIVKAKKIVKIVEVQNNESDNEIEIKPTKTVAQVAALPVVVASEVAVKKPRKPYVMSEETRQKKSEAMIAVRAKKMDNVSQRKVQKQEINEKDEIEMQNKVMKKITAEKKKREKELYQKLVQEDLNKHAAVDEKPKKVRKAAIPKPKVVKPEVELEPIEETYYQPQYTRPSLNYF